MDDIEVPTPFLCPISLQIMSEPVTVHTGITYDRENIERWLFSCKNTTCPVTKQSLVHTDLTPNHTLQRLIQSWCNQNKASLGTLITEHHVPTTDKAQILKLLSQASKFPDEKLNCLRRLRSIAFECESNKNCLESAGAIDFLASTMNTNKRRLQDSDMIIEAAIEVLFHLNPSGSQLKYLINNEEIQFLESLFHVLRIGNNQSRSYAIFLLKSAFDVAGSTQLSNVRTEFFVEIIRVIKDQISMQCSKSALKLLVELCSWGRNRVKAVEAGSVLVLIELLLAVCERRVCELILVALERLCGCAEGRAELLNHNAGLAIVSKKILRVSCAASDRGVKILSSICRYSATPKVLQEMLVVGAVSKLCLVVQVEGSLKVKERAKEILKLHSLVWKSSTCIPLPLLSLYP